MRRLLHEAKAREKRLCRCSRASWDGAGTKAAQHRGAAPVTPEDRTALGSMPPYAQKLLVGENS